MDLLDILRKKWTIEILKLLSLSNKSYTEIEDLVKNSSTTSKRLKGLEALNIIKREVQQDRKRTVHYSLTDLGQKLLQKIKEIENIDPK